MNWFPKQVVVVPVDFSSASFDAVSTALEIAANSSGVHVVHVLPEPATVEPGVIWPQADNDPRPWQATAAIRDHLADERFKDVKIEIAFGDPGYRIAKFAQEIGADLIITPSHGKTNSERVLVGSVAERVIRLSHCPVLVLRR